MKQRPDGHLHRGLSNTEARLAGNKNEAQIKMKANVGSFPFIARKSPGMIHTSASLSSTQG